ncbi:MAG: response regulator [FCB group bacterium]|nr:response regulator [FCB group bacterium]
MNHEEKSIREISVLLVDDDQTIVELISSMLGKLNVKEVIIASCGNDAIKLYLDTEPDIVFTDYVLEDIDGVTIMKVIKVLNPDIPIVLFTGYYDRLFKRLLNEDWRPEFVLQKPNIGYNKIKEAFFECFPHLKHGKKGGPSA